MRLAVKNLTRLGSDALGFALDSCVPGAGAVESAPTAIHSVDPTTSVPSTRVPLEDEVTNGPMAAPRPAPEATTSPATRPEPAPTPAASGNYAVQAGAYSSKASDERVAESIGGFIESSGRL